MSIKPDINSLIEDFIAEYTDNVRSGFDRRWDSITPEIYDSRTQECIGGLLSRQAVLTIEMARSPSTWNAHIAPLFLRCMIDGYITLAWILEKPNERSDKYIAYGLGQEKLHIEYMEEALRNDATPYDAENLKRAIDSRREWLNSQQSDLTTVVNVGSWAGMSTRDMARAIGKESVYKHAYVPFSGAVHNMWQHISMYNLKRCQNPMHKWHFVPGVWRAPADPHFMYTSAKFTSLSYEAVDAKMKLGCAVVLPEVFLLQHPLFSTDSGNVM